MATKINMPQLSDTMSSGKIVEWKKAVGETVVRGDILAEVETDKANLEIECFAPGVILSILVPAGASGKVGEPIAVIGQPGEASETSNTQTSKSEPQIAQKATQPALTTPRAPQIQPAPQSNTTKDGSSSNKDERVKASPLAKKVAEQLQVSLGSLTGSGPEGRIVRADVEKAAGSPKSTDINSTKPNSSTTSAPASIPGSGTVTPFSKMRETIARRMQESMQTAPHFYVTTSVEMDSVLKLREQLKETDAYKGISVNHFIIKACGVALSKEPRVNAAVRDGATYQPAQINIGIITSVGDGLLIPVVKEADSLAMKDLVFEAKAAVDRARAGRPNSSDLVGGTFSISNMGMFDVENFTAIINPGQGAILAVSSTKPTPVVKNGVVQVANVMKVTVSVDHRIIDGLMAATFLKHFKEVLETPALLFV